jgi:hypothetical protein
LYLGCVTGRILVAGTTLAAFFALRAETAHA